MPHHERLSRTELTRLLREADRLSHSHETGEKDRLFHELQQHKVELEIQNRDLRESQQALEESQDKYAELYDFAPVGYLTLDEKGIIQNLNLTAAAMLGKERSHLLGHPLRNLLAAEHRDALFGHLRRTVSSKTLTTTFVNLSGEAGKEALEFRLDSRIQSDARGNTHCFSALVNVTEMKADTQRRLAREQSLRQTLIREVHHRIKNHLHGVMGLLYCCKENHSDPSTVLDKAIGQISSIATVYGLQSRDSAERIRLTEMLRACVDFYAGATEVQVSGQAADDYMNPEETVPVALILNELMANAVKHTTNGARDPSVKVALKSVGDTIQLNISNRCDGLPEDLDIRSGTGLGTGLELLRALLPRHGIRLDLRWRDGRANADLVFETPILWRQAETPVA